MERSIKDNLEKTNQDGFTLLEVLIAIAILSMLMVSVYTIIENSTNTRDRVVSEDQEVMQLETGLARIEEDIQYMYSPLYFEATKEEDEKLFNQAYKKNTKQQIDNYIDEDPSANFGNNDNYEGLSESNRPIPIITNEEKGSLVFLSSAGRRLLLDSKQSNFMWVKYQVVTRKKDEYEDEESSTGSFALTRSTINENLYDPNIDWEKTKQYIVLDNLAEFEFQFWHPKRERFVSSIKELNEFHKTPRLIKVVYKVVGKSGDTQEGERTIRVIWPNFDTQAALKEKYKFNNTGPSGGLTGGKQGEDEEFE